MTSSPEESSPASAATTLPDLEPYSNKNNLDDQVFSAMSADGGLKVTVATIRNLLNEFMIQHTMNPIPGDALGRATLCAMLASNGMQEEQMFQLTMKGDGPLRGCCAIVTGLGEARGYVGSPSLGDDFTLTEAIGKGTVQVVKNHPDWPRPYNGITEIKHGDIDRDVGLYLAESEQRSCALAAATSWNGILCTAAGGYLVERLPDCSPETMSHMERNLAKLVAMNGEDGEALPTNLMLEGKTPVDIAEILLDGLGMEPLGQLEPKPKCPCSEDKLVRSLLLLPRAEVDSILKDEGKVEARCQFCGAVYTMGPEQVEERLNAAKGDASSDEEWEKELKEREDK
jgi:molecular chaperone Hsp33